MSEKERAYQYAKYYRVTANRNDYLKAVASHVGKEFLVEAELAWQSIDAYTDLIEL